MAKTLLLADDSVTIQKVVGISFASEDVTLITVDNGDDAIAKARETSPDAILADVVMPGKNGYEVCDAIKADPALRHVPVLLLTGTFEAFDEERAERCGAAGHVAKPFEAQALVERVRELLASPPAAAPEPSAAPQAAAPLSEPPASDAAGSFEFFEDDLGQAAAPAPAVDGADPLDLEPRGGAFAFGDDDLGADPEPLGAPLDAAPVRTEAFTGAIPERTVAMLPEEPSAPPAEAGGASFGTEGFADDLLGPDLSDPGDALPSGEESFDFDIAGPPPSPRRGGGDVAQASVLDPKGASGFDVSSSDLGDSLGIGPIGARPDPIGEPPFEAPDPEPPADPEPPPALDPPELSAVAAPEPDFAAPEPAPVDPAVLAEPAFDALESAPLDAAPQDAAFDIAVEETSAPLSVPAVALDESALEDLAPPVSAEPVDASQAVAATHDPAALAGVALAEITPQLRKQLHDTLEKIAWESFGDVAEQLVQQALERVERVAWEVIPQMAETLIREEIRRLKGEVED